MENKRRPVKYILSIDGGGVRGIIPAMILSRLEALTGKSCRNIFDMCFGTSTGSIICFWLACGYDMKDLVAMYQNLGLQIFAPKSWLAWIVSWFCLPSYSTRNFCSILQEYFGDIRLKLLHRCGIKIATPVYDIKNKRLVIFKSWKEGFWETKIKDVILAATAAPTYFSPFVYKDKIYVDGGICVNNPAMCAYTSAKRLFPDSDIVILSLGTGTKIEKEQERKRSLRHITKWGKLGWIKTLLAAIFDSSDKTVDYQLNEIFSSAKERSRYRRIQIPLLPQVDHDMDQVSQKNIDLLMQSAQKWMEANFDKQVAPIFTDQTISC